MTKRRRQPELPSLEMTPEQQVLINSLKQQSIKALAERGELPCPRCEQPLQAINYSSFTVESAGDKLLWCSCGFREY